MILRLALCLLLVPAVAQARTARKPAAPLTPPEMCEAAIAAAEAAAKLPAGVLAAIALRESGHSDPQTGRTRPWPWTTNFEGAGHYYPTKEEAIAAVEQIRAGGGQSVDVGCMQVNLMYHPAAFSTLQNAFDPAINANYAARFLKRLQASRGDWGTAIGAYHSQTPGKSDTYRDQVVANWHPNDPSVLAKQPAAPIRMGRNLTYNPFAVPLGPYQSFLPVNVAYADFAPRGKPGKAGRPLDLRLGGNGFSQQRGLIVPKAVITGTNRPPAVKPVPVRFRTAE